MFMNLTFTQIIQRVFENKIFPAIGEIVERVVESISIKGKVSL
jgi:hypothetical protein